MARQRYYFSDKLARRQRNLRICLAVLLILAVSAGSAWSHESGAAPVFSSPLSMADKCLPLLKSVRPIAPDTAMDNTQRPAGPAAVLGLAFGVRYALGPREAPQHAPRSVPIRTLVDFRQPPGDIDGRNALATAAYRFCRKREALSGPEQRLQKDPL